MLTKWLLKSISPSTRLRHGPAFLKKRQFVAIENFQQQRLLLQAQREWAQNPNDLNLKKYTELLQLNKKKAQQIRRTQEIVNYTYILYIALACYGIYHFYGIKFQIPKQLKMANTLFDQAIEPQTNIKTTFDNVFGIDQHKEELQEIVDFLKNPAKYKKMGAELPRGLLLVGPPGTGKTLLARALAGEAGCKLFYKSGSEFDEMLVGLGAKRVRALFRKAKSVGPSIIFIDQIDSIAGKRIQKSPNHSNTTLNQLLTEMDGFNTSDNVVVIGATNFEQVIDPAIKRPGRFDKIVHIPLPDRKGREQLINFYLGKIKHGELDIKDLAGQTDGFTGADIQNMVNVSIIKAIKEGQQQAQKQHFQYALERIQLGIKSNRKQTQTEKQATAVHESGHALVAHLTPRAPIVRKVTIRGAGPAKGYTSFHNDRQNANMTQCELQAMIDVALGGRVAEQLFLGQQKVSSGCGDDLKKATQYAYSLLRLKQDGILATLNRRMSCSDKFKFEIDEKANQILETSYGRVRKLLSKNKKLLQAMSRMLVQKQTIDAEDIKQLGV